MPRFTLRCRALPAALIAAFAAALMLLAFAAQAARAGTYDVVACGAAPNGEHSSWQISSQSAGYVAGFSCPAKNSQMGMYGRNGVGVGTAPSSSQTSLTFTAPAGASVSGLTLDGQGGTSEDWFSSVATAGGSTIWGCLPNDGVTQCSYLGNGAFFNVGSAPSVTFTVGCYSGSGCPTAWDGAGLTGVGAQGWFYLQSARVTVKDSSAPALSVTGGGLTGSGWLSGSQNVTLSSSDIVGVKGTSFSVDGVPRDSQLQVCDYTKTVPCPASATQAFSLDTRTLADGSHTLSVSATDSANNTTSSSSTTFRVDNSAPAAPLGVSVDQGEGWRTGRDYSVHWTNPMDAGSPVARAWYRLCRADAPSSCSPLQSQAGDGISSLSGITVPGDGDWLLSVYLEDALGNASAANASIPVHLRSDATAPDAVSGLRVAGGEGWRAVDSFDVDWDDPVGEISPLVRSHYRVCDAGGACFEGVENTGSLRGISVPGPGDYTLAVWREDTAGNVGTAGAELVHLRFDNADPGAAAPSASAGWLSDDGPYVERISLDPGAVEPLSGIAGYSVSLDGSEPDGTPETGPDGEWTVDQLPEGRMIVKARAVSGSGVASSSTESGLLLVDRSAPSVEAVGAPDPERWQSGPVSVALRAADQTELSGVGRIEWSVDGETSAFAEGSTAAASVTGNGVHVLSYRALDAAGNASAVRTLSVRIDGEAPGLAVVDFDGGWSAPGRVAGRVRMAEGARVPASGMAGYSLTFDGSSPDGTVETDANGAFEIPSAAEGVTVVRARAVSGAGVPAAEVGSAEIRVDGSAPDVAVEGVDDRWHRGPVELTLRASDALAGMDGGRIVYSLDGGPERSAPGASPLQVSVDGDGRHELTYAAVDAVGNRSPARTAQVLIDGTAPESVALEEPASATAPSQIVARAMDRGSGVVGGSIEMRPAGVRSWHGLPTRFEDGRLLASIDGAQLAHGLYEFRARAIDAAGNERIGSELADGRSLELTLGAEVAPVPAPVAAAPVGPVVPVAPAPPAAPAPAKHLAKHKPAHCRRIRRAHGRHVRKCVRRKGGEKHRPRHSGRKTHKHARRTAG